MIKKDKKSESQKLEKRLEELEENWKRALADYQNLEKRIAAEKEEFVRFANSSLILKILPALDSLEKAAGVVKDEGLDLGLKQLKEGLVSSGLEKISVLGLDFDPEEMECVDLAQGKEGQVLTEIRPGYKLGGKVLRVAQVRVGKGKIGKEELKERKLSKKDETHWH